MADRYSNETWRPVVGYEGWYEVSDSGRVKRTKTVPGTWAGRMLALPLNSYGYPCVCLHRSTRDSQKTFTVHRLVMAAFVGPCPLGREVNHKNGVKTGNRVGNLEYVTGKENRRHAREVLGMSRKGENNPRAKLTEDAVREIRRHYRRGVVTQRQLASEHGVSPGAIAFALRNRTWSHVVD